MSEFYGRIQGSRGEATRCGSKDSGISATAETWGSVLRVGQRTASYTESGHAATISIQGKYGGTALYLDFDADTVYQESEDPEVKAALQEVSEAMDRADAIAKLKAQERANTKAAA